MASSTWPDDSCQSHVDRYLLTETTTTFLVFLGQLTRPTSAINSIASIAIDSNNKWRKWHPHPWKKKKVDFQAFCHGNRSDWIPPVETENVRIKDEWTVGWLGTLKPVDWWLESPSLIIERSVREVLRPGSHIHGHFIAIDLSKKWLFSE